MVWILVIHTALQKHLSVSNKKHFLWNSKQTKFYQLLLSLTPCSDNIIVHIWFLFDKNKMIVNIWWVLIWKMVSLHVALFHWYKFNSSQYTLTMANIYDYDEGEIAAIIICGGLLLGLVVCMGMCGVLYG